MLILTSEISCDLIDRLTEGQRDCLQLVARLHSSKEIARKLAISPHTVDQRLKRAQSILGVSSRFEAARLFTETIGKDVDPYQQLVYQGPELSAFQFSDNKGASPDDESPEGDERYLLRQTQEAYYSGVNGPQTDVVLPKVLFAFGKENRLGIFPRLIIIASIMLVSIMSMAAIVSLAESISRLS